MHGEPQRKSPLQSLIDGTLTEDDARKLYEGMRWPNGIVCPLDECGGSGAWRIEAKGKTLKSGRVIGPRSLYRCKACRRQFSVTKGTIFEDSKIPLRMWLVTMFRMCSSKKGVAARQISRELGISPENAWFMLHRIRFAMTDKNPTLLTGVVEADETYIGGKPRGQAKMRAAKYTMSERITIAKGNKTPVFGMKERGGRVIAQAIPGMTQKKVERALFDNIDHTSARLMTDEAPYYYWMKKRLPHDVIRHSSTYVRGEIHTQGIESFWATLKRGLTGIHHHVDAGYLNQYVQEFAFRANTRHMSDTERFTSLVKNVGGRLYWYHGKRAKKISQPYEQDEPYERV